MDLMNTDTLILLFLVCIIAVSCESSANRGKDKLVPIEPIQISLQKPVELDSLYNKIGNLKTRTESDWALLAVSNNTKWGVVNSQGTVLLNLAFDNFASVKASFAMNKSGLWTIYNAKSEALHSIACDNLVGHRDSHYIAMLGGKKALVNENSSTPYLFDDITGPREDKGYFYGKISDVWRAYDLEGQIVDNLSKIQRVGLQALNNYKVSLYGYGPIRLGMSIPEVEKTIGLKFIENGSSSDCKMMEFEEGFPLVRMLFDMKDGIRLLERIYINESTIKTKSGIGIYSREKEILNAYQGKMEKQSHKYNEQCLYYYYVPADEKDQAYRLNFDYNFKEDIVRHYSVGRVPAIFYVEGCF